KELSNILKKQLNTKNIDIKIVNFSNFHEKVHSLYADNLVSVNANTIISKIGPRLKNDLSKALQAFEQVNLDDLYGQLMSRSYFNLKYSSGAVELSRDDIEIIYEGKPPYVMVESEQNDIMVFIDTTRSNELISMGLVKDIARHIQQLRKERGFVPTEILSSAHISNLDPDDSLSLENYKKELAYYVRVKDIVLSHDKLLDAEYKEIDIDGKKILISVQ